MSAAPAYPNPSSLTEVLGGCPILGVDHDQPGPQDLQGRDVGGQDAEGARLRGHVHLSHVGAVEIHLEGGRYVNRGGRDRGDPPTGSQ